MKVSRFFEKIILFSIINILILLNIILKLNDSWFLIHIFLIFGYLLIITIGIYGFSNLKKWATYNFLILFFIQAINGLILLYFKISILSVIYLFVSIIALFNVANNADLVYRLILFKNAKKKILIKKKDNFQKK